MYKGQAIGGHPISGYRIGWQISSVSDSHSVGSWSEYWPRSACLDHFYGFT